MWQRGAVTKSDFYVKVVLNHPEVRGCLSVYNVSVWKVKSCFPNGYYELQVFQEKCLLLKLDYAKKKMLSIF